MGKLSYVGLRDYIFRAVWLWLVNITNKKVTRVQFMLYLPYKVTIYNKI